MSPGSHPYWMDILHYIVPPLLPPGGPKGKVVGEMPGSCCSQDSVYSAALAMTRDCHYTWPFYAHARTCQD